ncbi:unnamed protein product [Didymodactylos carnosus]|uniref:EIF-4F 25 kDa subunit n=1 Tax=Didymodactylos carnosus TaxID=1234261 RepID=A0A813TEX5_9BILA|nr:unnamed protein product [Didymodactylos carnosus]CAF1054300.1 unnamed protein product [Didymodactylos carnosus]CAF3599477.1 unnamed protein product [Didymodactylos carnosus]CAF3820661.1 unnamed protein product [Didymodactylos carnosus]
MTSTNNSQKEEKEHEINPKSPLEYPWSFWYIKPDKRSSWEDSLIRIMDVKHVEDFWATYNHLQIPSKLARDKSNCDYYFFKTGIRPMWEDKRNSSGGRWLLSLGRDEMKLDEIWTETLLSLIGDLFSFNSDPTPLSSFITGAVVNIRQRGHKVALWTSEARNEMIVREIGRRWKKMIQLHPQMKIQFDLHNEGGGPHQRPMYEE